ncbi:MAG: hypothetical protein KA152_01845 [Verrucomicrobiales bacterium]|nr:hypothetical protein [Verrucomicrobiales bacterium]HQW29378.1 hypothetical protein [Verrucomicrobiales bacterium]
MENLKHFFVDNWRSKLVSLFIAVSIWYLIKSHLDSAVQLPPVPGTGTTTPIRRVPGPVLDDTLLGPLIPMPAPIPVPGGDVKG